MNGCCLSLQRHFISKWCEPSRGPLITPIARFKSVFQIVFQFFLQHALVIFLLALPHCKTLHPSDNESEVYDTDPLFGEGS